MLYVKTTKTPPILLTDVKLKTILSFKIKNMFLSKFYVSTRQEIETVTYDTTARYTDYT